MKQFTTLMLITILFTRIVSAQISFDKQYPFIDITYSDAFGFTVADGYLLVTQARITPYVHYLAIIKTDLFGDTLWVKYNDIGITPFATRITGGITDPQGNIYLTAYQANFGFMKFDSEGNFVWGKDYPDLYFEPVYGNNFLWAVMQNDSESVCYLYKINPNNGGAAWRTVIFDNSNWWPTSMDINENGDIAVAVAQTVPLFYNEYIMRIFIKPVDSSNFSFSYLDLERNMTFLDKIKYSGNDLCGIAHYPSEYSPIDYSSYVRFTPTGNKLLEKEISFSALGSYAYAFDLNHQQDAVFLCYVYYDIDSSSYYELSIKANGETNWCTELPYRSYDGINNCNDGGFIFHGISNLSPFDHPFLYKIDSLGIVVNTNNPSRLDKSVHLYPNPAHGLVTFSCSGVIKGSLKIYDSSGKRITSVVIQNNLGYLNTNQLRQGIYFYTSEEGMTGKFLKM